MGAQFGKLAIAEHCFAQGHDFSAAYPRLDWRADTSRVLYDLLQRVRDHDRESPPMPPHVPPTSATCGAGSAAAREVGGTILAGGEGRGAIIARARGCAEVRE